MQASVWLVLAKARPSTQAVDFLALLCARHSLFGQQASLVIKGMPAVRA